jgi:hypothetical protein
LPGRARPWGETGAQPGRSILARGRLAFATKPGWTLPAGRMVERRGRREALSRCRRKHEPKYEPLSRHLRTAPRPVSMTFAEISRLVGGLPPSAYRYREWWANDHGGRHVQAHAWLEFGRQVAECRMAYGHLCGRGPLGAENEPAPLPDRHDPAIVIIAGQPMTRRPWSRRR